MGRCKSSSILVVLMLGLCACRGEAPPDAAPTAAAEASPPTAPAAAAAPGPADADVIDVCARFPRAVIERVLGDAVEVRDLNITAADAPMRTEPGYGGCNYEGAGFAGLRVEVGTAQHLQRARLGSPRHYIERFWSAGEAGDETVPGLGVAARLRATGEQSVVVAAAGEDRFVQVMASQVPREQVLAVVEAALTMPLVP
jgi:hypothetical protein